MERGKYLGQMIVATRPCGCAQGWMWSDAFKPKEIAKTTGQWVADGCFIEHLTRYENDGLMEKPPVKCGVHAGTHTDWVSSVDEKPVRNGPYEVAPLNHWLHGREPKPNASVRLPRVKPTRPASRQKVCAVRTAPNT